MRSGVWRKVRVKEVQNIAAFVAVSMFFHIPSCLSKEEGLEYAAQFVEASRALKELSYRGRLDSHEVDGPRFLYSYMA